MCVPFNIVAMAHNLVMNQDNDQPWMQCTELTSYVVASFVYS